MCHLLTLSSSARFLPTAVVALVVFSFMVAHAAEGDWSGWRGPNRDAISTETGLLARWTGDGPPLVREAKNVGRGYASEAVAGGRVYTMVQRDGEEFLIALDTADGHDLRAAVVGKGDHSNCTPTVDAGGRLYLRDQEVLMCYDLRNQ